MANPFIDVDPGELCIKVGDQEPSWLFRLRRGDAAKTPVDVSTLTEPDIQIRIKHKGTTTAPTVGDISAIVDDGTEALRGLVRYDPTPSDVDTEGVFEVEIVTDRAGIEATFPVQGFFIVNIAKRAA
jgi:hypothetical protein